MEGCAIQASADLLFVEQIEYRTTRHVMLKHKEFEFTTLEIVSLIMSLTSRVTLKGSHFLTHLCISAYKKGSMCNLIAARCKNVTCFEPFTPPDSCCRMCGKLNMLPNVNI